MQRLFALTGREAPVRRAQVINIRKRRKPLVLHLAAVQAAGFLSGELSFLWWPSQTRCED